MMIVIDRRRCACLTKCRLASANSDPAKTADVPALGMFAMGVSRVSLRLGGGGIKRLTSVFLKGEDRRRPVTFTWWDLRL